MGGGAPTMPPPVVSDPTSSVSCDDVVSIGGGGVALSIADGACESGGGAGLHSGSSGWASQSGTLADGLGEGPLDLVRDGVPVGTGTSTTTPRGPMETPGFGLVVGGPSRT